MLFLAIVVHITGAWSPHSRRDSGRGVIAVKPAAQVGRLARACTFHGVASQAVLGLEEIRASPRIGIGRHGQKARHYR